MTEQTQTTAVWVESVLETELHLIPLMVGVNADSADIGGMDGAAQTIAAEIDALTAERDDARELHKFCDLFLNSANAELKRCESALRLALAGTEQKYFAIPARIDDVRAALADAQSQLAEARAEIERLRPLAEEWEKWREFLMANESAKASAGLLAYDWMEAARARAAKGTP